MPTHAKFKVDRRRFIVALGLLPSIAVTSQGAATERLFQAAVAYERKPGHPIGRGQLLSQQQMVVLRSVCDQVIPKTETPGAVEVDTHGFVDNQLAHCYPTSDQKAILLTLNELNQQANDTYASAFDRCNVRDQLQLLNSFEQKSPRGANFALLKSLIVFGFLTSEQGAMQMLGFDPVPGQFKGSVPYDQIGRSWLAEQ